MLHQYRATFYFYFDMIVIPIFIIPKLYMDFVFNWWLFCSVLFLLTSDVIILSMIIYYVEPEQEYAYHIGVIVSPNYLNSKKTGKFTWTLNLNAPDSNTIVFTILSVKSSVENCDKIRNMAMLSVKPGKWRPGRRRRRKNKKKNGDSESPSSVNYCLADLEEGTEFRIHSLQATVTFYTSNARRFAFTMDYKPGTFGKNLSVFRYSSINRIWFQRSY